MLGGTSQSGVAGRDLGRLSGVAQITYGCPGPQREGAPCEHWSAFAGARFRVTAVGTGEARLVTSDRRGRFTLLLATGRYRANPLRQRNTTGGPTITVRILPAATTFARIRFQGFPRML